MTIPLQDWVRMSWSSCRSETETCSGRYIYDKESDRWRIDCYQRHLPIVLSTSFILPGLWFPGGSDIENWYAILLINVSLSIYLSQYLSLLLFLCASIFLSIYLSIFHSLFIFLFLSLSQSFFIYLHIYFSTFSTYLSLSLSIYRFYSGSRQSRQYA